MKRSEAAELATSASLKRRRLGKAVIDAAIQWVDYIKNDPAPSSWKSMHQIRLCEAVEAFNECLKYG